jgi:drug/metabolite transporter (DMT)-like permease
MPRHSVGISPTVSLISASALWAIATVISKKLLTSVPPITLLVLQLAPSVLLLWSLTILKGGPRPHWRSLAPVALIGLLNPGLAYTLSMLGLTRTTASVATLLWAAEPVLIVALAWLLLREPVTRRLITLTVAAACGVLLVSGLLVTDDLRAVDAFGNGLILAGVLCCGVYTVLSRKMATEVDPLLMVSLQQSAGLLWALAIWPLELRKYPPEFVLGFSPGEIAGATASGIMYYAAAFWLYLKGLSCVRASVAGGFLNLIPVFGVATAYLFLGERLTAPQWIGAITIVLCVFILLMWGPGSGRVASTRRLRDIPPPIDWPE